MTNILAIETSSVYCSIGLAKNKEIYIEHSQEENTHGKNIFGFIDNLLKKSQLEKEELDFIALSVGPGSFTGLRVGCSVAQGLAFGLQKKILPLSSLLVLAQTVFLEQKAKELFIVKEAHMNDLYVGKYIRKNNDLAHPLIDDAAIKKKELSDFISSDNKEILLKLFNTRNNTAGRFYSSFDFSTVGIRKNYYKDGSDAVLKEKKLITK